jgi:hypothetical protein
MSDNLIRGVIELELDGAKYPLRPSYDAILAFEAQTGRALMDLAEAAGLGRLNTSEIAVIVTECIRETGRASDDKVMANVNQRRIGELIIAEGQLIVLKRLELMLYLAASGGISASGELKARPTKTQSTPAGGSRGSRRPR